MPFEQLHFDKVNFPEPEIASDELGKLSKRLLINFMKLQSIIFKCNKLNPSKLNKHDAVHVFGFVPPVDFHHGTHIIIIIFGQFKCIWNSIPSLQKRRSHMLPMKTITPINLKNLRIFSVCFDFRIFLGFLLLGSFCLDYSFVEVFRRWAKASVPRNRFFSIFGCPFHEVKD